MSYPINYPTPQGANVQVFNYDFNNAYQSLFTWVKPQGANMVWFTLIGAGGGGGGTDGSFDFGGGGSGAVTNLMIPAFLIPDNLSVCVGGGGYGGAAGGNPGGGGDLTYINTYLSGYSTGLLTAYGGGGGDNSVGGTGGSAMGANFFTAAGFFQSIAGQPGAVSTTLGASSTTFLSGGTSGTSSTVTSNYGYSTQDPLSANSSAGYFQMQPIIVGVGGAGSTNNVKTNAIGGIGCGGGGTRTGSSPGTGARGGNGLAVIITW